MLFSVILEIWLCDTKLEVIPVCFISRKAQQFTALMEKINLNTKWLRRCWAQNKSPQRLKENKIHPESVKHASVGPEQKWEYVIQRKKDAFLCFLLWFIWTFCWWDKEVIYTTKYGEICRTQRNLRCLWDWNCSDLTVQTTLENNYLVKVN